MLVVERAAAAYLRRHSQLVRISIRELGELRIERGIEIDEVDRLVPDRLAKNVEVVAKK
jgi:hypothetical protein